MMPSLSFDAANRTRPENTASSAASTAIRAGSSPASGRIADPASKPMAASGPAMTCRELEKIA